MRFVPAPAFVTELLAAVRSASTSPAGLRIRHPLHRPRHWRDGRRSRAPSAARCCSRLPFRDPERLVTVYRTTPHFDTGPFSPANYTDLARERRDSSTASRAIASTTALLQLTDEAAQVSVKRVTGNLVPLLGVRALRGRMLTGRRRPTRRAPGRRGRRRALARAIRRRPGDSSAKPIRPRRAGVHRSSVSRHAASESRTARRSFARRCGSRCASARTSCRSAGDNYLYGVRQAGSRARRASPRTPSSSRIFDGVVAANPVLRGEQVRALSLVGEGVRSVRKPLLPCSARWAWCCSSPARTSPVCSSRGRYSGGASWRIRSGVRRDTDQLMRPVLSESSVMTAVGLLTGLPWRGPACGPSAALAAARLPTTRPASPVDYRVIAFADSAGGRSLPCVCGGLPAWRSSAVDPQDALR